MGQYYVAVNKRKREYICPWCLGGVAKLWEWAANSQAGIFPALLAKTDGAGGGDPNWDAPEIQAVFGRWAGDPVFLVGDYDSTKLYDEARDAYTNISEEVGVTVQGFLEGVNGEWEVKTCGSCRKKQQRQAA
jgi:hypothetical protein